MLPSCEDLKQEEKAEQKEIRFQDVSTDWHCLTMWLCLKDQWGFINVSGIEMFRLTFSFFFVLIISDPSSTSSVNFAPHLSTEKISGQSVAFHQAAQTIRTKVQFDFYELPADSYGSLRDSMLNHIDRPKQSSKKTHQELNQALIEYLWIYDISMIYLWIYLWNIYDISMIYLWYIYEYIYDISMNISMIYLRYIYEYIYEYIYDISMNISMNISMIYLWYIYDISMIYYISMNI